MVKTKANRRNGEKMKRFVKIIVFMGAILLCIGFKSSASDSRGEYTITQAGDIYILSSGVNITEHYSLGDCFQNLDQGAIVRLENITCADPVIFPNGEYSISGELHAKSVITISQGIKLRMESLTLSLDTSAFVRIKGGSLTVSASSITGKGLLIKLDYSSSSEFNMISGIISGASKDPLIDIQNGRAFIRGGDIDNSAGAAIRNDSELCLSSSPVIRGLIYGIVLESPMYLGASQSEYYSSEPLSVQYMDEFAVGSLTEIFYDATARSVSKIQLYDKNGKEEILTHFEKCKHTDEENFAGVYLPHIVKFYVGDKVVMEQRLLSGEKISSFSPSEQPGYVFDNWYIDRDANELYSSEKPVYSSFSLYSSYRLLPPTFSISSKEFVYNGEEHIVKFDSLTHVLSGGYYSFKWYKDGAEISDFSEISVKNVSDSGIYSCLVTYTLNGKTASVYATNIKINIEKLTVCVPDIPSASYTGTQIYPTIPDSAFYSYSSVVGTNVAIYPVIFTLADPDNTKWNTSDEKSITAYFEITKSENRWLVDPKAQDSYIGFPLKSFGTPIFGEVIFLYSVTENGNYTAELPKSPGCYFMKAAVAESLNYTSLISDPIPFNILSEQVVGLRVLSSPSKDAYCAFDKFDTSGMEIVAVYNSGREEIIEHHRLKIVYNNQSSLRTGDTGVIIEYMGASLLVPVTVSPLTYDLSSLSLISSEVEYNGYYQSYTISNHRIVGLDGIPLKCDISGGGVDVGVYTITVHFDGDSRDYLIPDDIEISLTIYPKEVSIVWGQTSFIYDSTPKLPEASFIDAMGVKREIMVCGSMVAAGEDYIASAFQYSKNYVYLNPTAAFNISKANYDISNVRWSHSSLVYTGEPVEVIVENLPVGVTVVGYTDNRAVNVGSYTATASLSYDDKNYNHPQIPSHSWSITPAEYDLSSFEFVSAEYEYDGDEHFPILKGTLPIGKDGIVLTYNFSQGAMNVSDGQVSVLITFDTQSKNYVAPAPILATVRIVPKGIYIVWTGSCFIYDGISHIPTAECSESPIRITGAGIDSGIYTATAVSKDSNYKIINSTHTYEIKKAENKWLSYPIIEDFYSSSYPSPQAESYVGEVVFKYYSDCYLTNEVYPIQPGQYYMIAIVPESNNYLELVSNPILFVCMEVKPIGINTKISGSPIAFSTLEGLISVFLIYNDGSQTEISYEDLEIQYQNNDSLRAYDTECLVSYGSFSKVISLTVSKATYDMSNTYWDNTEVEYDGDSHAPKLIGLPDGVNVISYSSNPVYLAGEYVFSASLSYDAENYFPPIIADCSFRINKASIPVVLDTSFEYNGFSIYIPSTDLYYPILDTEIKDSGIYKVGYKLIDSDNYIFYNGSDVCYANVIVNPKILSICVSDFDLYMFETDIYPEYTVEGLISGIDAPGFYYYLDGDKIYIGTDDTNYILEVDYGTVNKISYPSVSMRKRIALIVILTFMVVSLLFITIKRRNEVIDAIIMLKAKKKNKLGLGYIDNSPRILENKDILAIDLETEEEDYSIELDSKPNFESAIFEDEERESIIEYSESIEELPKDEDITDVLEGGLEKSEVFNNEEKIEDPKIPIKMEYANSMITDAMARQMIKNEREVIYTDGRLKSIINVDTLSRNFIADDRVDVNILKEKSLVPYDTNYIKVLARGAIDKPLHVFANEFSLAAVKMILLSGGEARRVISIKEEKNKSNQ